MPKLRNVYQEGTKIKSMCRVCLTQSNTLMFKLIDPFKGEENINAKTYLEGLENATFTKVELNGKYPESICPMCISFLTITLQFITQFKASQKKLQVMFKSSTPAYYDTINPVEYDVQTISKIEDEVLSPVELIIKDQKYSLNELVVVENPDLQESTYDYKGFISKLGNEISATMVKNNPTHTNTTSRSSMSVVKEENYDTDIEYRDENIEYQEENIEYQEAIDNMYTQENEKSDFQDEDTEIEDDNIEETVEFIVEEVEQDTENDENAEECGYMLSNEHSDNIEEPENVEKEAYESKPRNDNSENGNLEYIEIDILDKYAIESLIIDRGMTDDDEEETEKPKRRRLRRKKIPVVPKDEFEKEVKFPCGVCKKIFSTPRALRNHVKRTHLKKYDKIFTCEICGTVCKTRSKFVNHKLQHFDKQFKCEQCNKTYSTKAHLKVHLSIHANIRPYLCNVCGKDFNYANALTYHMRLHTGEKNYHCEYCPQRFRMVNSLNRHLRTHTGEKPYKCQFCARHFSSKGEVVCHEYIHTGYRPYHCKYCKKGFSKTHNLKIHLLSHGGPFHCKFCAKTFIEESILNMHHKIAHKDLMTELKNEENSESNEGSQYDENIEFEMLGDDSNLECVEVYEDIEMDEIEMKEIELQNIDE